MSTGGSGHRTPRKKREVETSKLLHASHRTVDHKARKVAALRERGECGTEYREVLSPSTRSTITDPGAASSSTRIAFKRSPVLDAESSRTVRILIAGPTSRWPRSLMSALMCARLPVIRSAASAISELVGTARFERSPDDISKQPYDRPPS
jgi:hypothetical protein